MRWRLLSAPAVARATEAIALVGVLAALVVYVAPTLDAPLLEKHAFRQTQTAWTARVFHEDGIDLLHPKLPVFGAPFEAPFEFPLFQALATVPMAAGVAEDTSLRLTCLACFVLTALLLWGLVRHVAGPVSGVGAVVVFTFTPFALVWSRTSMIEYLATAGAVGFAFGVVLWRERRHPSLFVAALAAGLVGMLVKPTTAVFWILPAARIPSPRADPSGGRETDRPVARRARRGAARRSRRLDAARGRDQGREPGHRVAHELEPPALEPRLAGAAHRSECVVLDPSAHRPEPVEPLRRPARARCDRRVALDPAALLARRRLGGGAASARLHEPLRQS